MKYADAKTLRDFREYDKNVGIYFGVRKIF